MKTPNTGFFAKLVEANRKKNGSKSNFSFFSTPAQSKLSTTASGTSGVMFGKVKQKRSSMRENSSSSDDQSKTCPNPFQFFPRSSSGGFGFGEHSSEKKKQTISAKDCVISADSPQLMRLQVDGAKQAIKTTKCKIWAESDKKLVVEYEVIPPPAEFADVECSKATTSSGQPPLSRKRSHDSPSDNLKDLNKKTFAPFPATNGERKIAKAKVSMDKTVFQFNAKVPNAKLDEHSRSSSEQSQKKKGGSEKSTDNEKDDGKSSDTGSMDSGSQRHHSTSLSLSDKSSIKKANGAKRLKIDGDATAAGPSKATGKFFSEGLKFGLPSKLGQLEKPMEPMKSSKTCSSSAKLTKPDLTGQTASNAFAQKNQIVTDDEREEDFLTPENTMDESEQYQSAVLDLSMKSRKSEMGKAIDSIETPISTSGTEATSMPATTATPTDLETQSFSMVTKSTSLSKQNEVTNPRSSSISNSGITASSSRLYKQSCSLETKSMTPTDGSEMLASYKSSSDEYHTPDPMEDDSQLFHSASSDVSNTSQETCKSQFSIETTEENFLSTTDDLFVNPYSGSTTCSEAVGSYNTMTFSALNAGETTATQSTTVGDDLELCPSPFPKSVVMKTYKDTCGEAVWELSFKFK